MAFGTAGWRRIVIGGNVFYWQATEGLDELFRVRPELEPHRLLHVASSKCGHITGFLGSITPGVVRGAIECAIKDAWLGEGPKLRLIVFNNPVRYVRLQPSWLTSSVIALAEAIDPDGTFDRLPILADAREDAGCTNADVLNHCRGAGPHVRGCWVVDLLLGKE